MKYPQLVSMPSAVSDWLEEQLEARGIDSEVYTRYILSLLHAHTLDFLHPDDDLPFSGLKKDGGRSAVSHKRVRRTGTWWRHAHADAEQIKRSAAVECLMSAAEQGCEIESLVDELCEKLKEVNSEGDGSSNKSNQDGEIFKEPLEQIKISPKELAEKYYAAFPPLNHREQNSYFCSNITLVAGNWPSPDKNQIDLIAAKWTTSGSPKKSKRKAKTQLHEATMKPTSRTGQGRNRFGHKRTHCGRNVSKEIADNIANWEFVYNNNNYQIQDHCLDPVDLAMSNMDENDSPICRMKVWLQNAESDDYRTIKNNGGMKRSAFLEKKSKYISLYPPTIWSDNEDPSRYEWANTANLDLERARGFSEQDTYAVWSLEEESAIREEYQRSAKEEEVECAIKEEYDRPHELYGHEPAAQVEGQWDVNFNETAVQIGEKYSANVSMLSPCQMESDVINFGLVTSDVPKTQDDEFTRQNNANKVLEDMNGRRVVATVICKCCDDDDVNHWWCRDVSTMPLFVDLDAMFDDKTVSLMTLNHSVENSAFREYSRPALISIDGLSPGPFSLPFGRPLIKRPRPVADKTSSLKLSPSAVSPLPASEEEKLTSPQMYFEPIKPLLSREEPKEEKANTLQDGTTFNIKASLDEVKFQRTATGSLILETEFGELKKYFEYHWRPPSDESVKLPKTTKSAERGEFCIKYWVSPNDKSCQTVEALHLPPPGEDVVDSSTPAFQTLRPMIFASGGTENDGIKEDEACEWIIPQRDAGKEGTKQGGSENSLCEADDVIWGYAPKSSDVFCKYCNVKHPWPNNSLKKVDVDWDERTLKDIWGGTETCGTCPWSAKVPTPLVETTSKLREESKEEAERLLSDLSSLQLSYSARLLEAQFKSDEGPREKKRRHSYMSNDTDLWSFATRLQEDCLISLSTLPTRRSVTL